MRRSASELRALAGAAVALAWLACAPPPAPPIVAPPPAPEIAAPALALPIAPGRRPGSFAITPPQDTPLDFVLEPVPGGRSVLAVSQHGEERVAWVRRLGEAGSGPLLRFVDQHVVGAFDRSDGSTTYVTSDGTNLCFGTSARREDRACVASSPVAIVPVGDRLALLEIGVAHPPAPTKGAQPARPAPKPVPKPRHKESKSAKGAGKKKHGASGGSHRPAHPLVEVFVRWVEPGGAVDAEATSTGLHFEAPLDGMTLVDARARAPGIDVLWYETAPGRKTRSPLGSGRLMAASLHADGALDFASRVAVADADLEYGQLKDHRAPRLAGNDEASVALWLDARGQCEAMRARPTLAHLTVPPAVCAMAPDLLAGPLDPAAAAALERLAGEGPRRAAGQPKGDVGLVAWAGGRGYYLRKDGLRSIALADGTVRDEPPPFPAHRAPIAWGAIESDGEWAAYSLGLFHHLPGGGYDRGTPPLLPLQRATSVPDLPPDRRRAARIGATWWTAREPRARLWPQDLTAQGSTAVTPPSLDTSVLAGGPERGLSLDLAGGALAVSAVDADGTRRVLTTVSPSPVAPGLDACRRAAGGAIVAGAIPGNPRRLVAFTVDPAGRVGKPLPLRADLRHATLGVRLTPLPAGGAILTDLDRREVIWLDDDAVPSAGAEPPRGESDAVCPYGRPMPLEVPGPTPGTFIPVPGVDKDACLVGDPTWTRAGDLCWFGGTAEGLDFTPELTCLHLVSAFSIPVPLASSEPSDGGTAPPAATKPAPCPPEMVSVPGRVCVDRFESMIVDTRSFAPLSPDYPTTPNLLDFAFGEWSTGRERVGSLHARAFPLPWISPSRFGDAPPPLAVSRADVRPNGYLSGVVAAAACTAAGKRLCTLDEWTTACRGQDDTLFPYGDTYEDGVCNVFREDHPAALLHGNASVGHLDPRLSRVLSHGRPLLQVTGGSPACRSRWGDDAIYDMVGNLDEWVDEGAGAFAGGFYSRSTRNGCEALVTAHPKSYLDYSTGARCCKDPR